MKDKILRSLSTSSLFIKRGDIDIYEDVIHKIYLEKDISYIQPLLENFHDDTEFHEVMYSAVHLLESFPVEEYIEKLVKNIPFMLEHAPLWLSVLVNRILNEGVYVDLFKKFLKCLPKKETSNFIELMNKEMRHHKDIFKQIECEAANNVMD